MAKRDPNKTARNRYITEIDDRLNTLLPKVIQETGKTGVLSLNAYIGSKAGEFIELKTKVMRSPTDYINAWVQGMVKKRIEDGHSEIERDLKDPAKPVFKKYVYQFLERSFLKRYDEFSRVRPEVDSSYLWFGVNDAHYGLFITPRFKDNIWENDKSEIRVFGELYWTIGHVLETGLCIPDENRIMQIADVRTWLDFLFSQVRLTKSMYQIEIVRLYEAYVLAAADPKSIPLLIPEMRFDGSGRRHKYRLDFLIINPFTMEKIGIEISPWSTHGKIEGKGKSLVQINSEALANWEAEVQKSRAYFKRHQIFILHFTDSDLTNISQVFDLIAKYLDPGVPPAQTQFELFREYFQ